MMEHRIADTDFLDILSTVVPFRSAKLCQREAAGSIHASALARSRLYLDVPGVVLSGAGVA